jgi:3-oxoacyl-[acyl-carrier protein] reductase
MTRLDQKVVALTGAAGGLGTALASRFAREGAEALLLADIDELLLRERLAELRADHPHVELSSYVTDVRDPSAVDRFVAAATERYARLDIMVNNAGVLSPNSRIHNLTIDDWRSSIDINLLGTFNGIKAAVQAMRPRGGGVIINTASVAGMTAWAYTAPYGASKAAVIQLTRIAAVEYACDKIRVNCVCPGTFASPLFGADSERLLDAIGARHPLGLGTAEDVVGAFVYLASDEARWTTGSAVVVDGGYSAP